MTVRVQLQVHIKKLFDMIAIWIWICPCMDFDTILDVCLILLRHTNLAYARCRGKSRLHSKLEPLWDNIKDLAQIKGRHIS